MVGGVTVVGCHAGEVTCHTQNGKPGTQDQTLLQQPALAIVNLQAGADSETLPRVVPRMA